MVNRSHTTWRSYRLLLLTGGLYLLLNALAIRLLHGRAAIVTIYAFQAIPAWAAAAACWDRQRSCARVRLPWRLLSLAMLMWSLGLLCSLWGELPLPGAGMATRYYTFVFYLYGLPVLLAVTSDTQARSSRFFLWLDVLQIAAVSVLVYATFFSSLPFMPHQATELSDARIVQNYDVENLFLACIASLRLLTLPGKDEVRRFFGILAAFLWLYALCASLANRNYLATGVETTYYNLLIVIPFLVLTVLALVPSPVSGESPIDLLDHPVAMFLENASPVFCTLALFFMAIVQVRKNYVLGVTVLSVALTLYAFRAIAMQGQYMRSERTLRDARNQMEIVSLLDGLTGIANRRQFDQTLESEWKRGIRSGLPLSLLLIDIDHFKSFNDSFGHVAGDHCLIEVAATLRDSLPRSGDLLARYGGEEFAVILSSTDEAGARRVAERLQMVMHRLNAHPATTLPREVTISIGVATVQWPSAKVSQQGLIEEADRALYLAKSNGRNRIEVFPVQPLPPTPDNLNGAAASA